MTSIFKERVGQVRNQQSIEQAVPPKHHALSTQHYNTEDRQLQCLDSVAITFTCTCYGHEAQSINSAMLLTNLYWDAKVALH
jgi:hypothetical protein